MSIDRNRRAVLFDLDGTLLPVEMDFFLKHYMDAIAAAFAPMMEPPAFKKALMEATFDTIRNTDPSVGNLDAFAAAFTRRSGMPWESTWPVIQRYYLEEYPLLRKHVLDLPGEEARVSEHCSTVRLVLRQCIDNGWDIVLATQPIFPETAVRERMRWCGIEDFPWRFISNLDNMHFCKPHLEYYREVLDCAGLEPARCVMVGNDMQEDMVAKRVGTKTFLVEDYLIDRGEDLAPDGRGRLADVPEAIERLLPA